MVDMFSDAAGFSVTDRSDEHRYKNVWNEPFTNAIKNSPKFAEKVLPFWPPGVEFNARGLSEGREKLLSLDEHLQKWEVQQTGRVRCYYFEFEISNLQFLTFA